MIAEADRTVNAKIGGIAEQADAEENRLAAAKSSTLKFIQAMREACNKELKNLEDIGNGFIPEEMAAAAEAEEEEPTVSVPAPAPSSASIEDAVRSIERSVSRIQPEERVDIDITPAMGKSSSSSRLDSTQPFSF